MLSKESEQFLSELHWYLISKGKNDREINEITEELEVHLMEAESEGKDVSHIIGESPKKYIKSIGKSMRTDYREITILVPMAILLLAAYFSIGPAIEGNFSVTKGTILFALIASVIGLGIYSILLFKVLPRFVDSKWSYFLIFTTFLLVTGVGVVVLLWYTEQHFQSIYTATPFQNNLIVVVCIVIFIASALYTKTWFTILVPFFLSFGPLANRLIPNDINKNPIYIMYTILLLVIVSTVIILYMMKRKKIIK